MAKKKAIYVRGWLCFLTAFIIGRMFGEIDNTKLAGKIESAETVDTELKNKEGIWQDFSLQKEITDIGKDNEGTIKVKEERPLKTGINVYNSFAQIETNLIHKSIEFPSFEIAGEEDVADFINEQIYSEIIPDDFEQYHNGREDVEIQYEIENINNEIISIHFWGYQSYWGSYTGYDKGLNFNLQTGSVISLKDYYTLSDIKMIIDDARKENEIKIYENLIETEQEIDDFMHLLDSEEYIEHTDMFFLKENYIYFIVPWDEVGRQYYHIELGMDKFSKLQ